jgi:hypothetical protein
MTMHFETPPFVDLPTGDLYVSSYCEVDGVIEIRLINDFDPAVIGSGDVFCLKLTSISDLTKFTQFLSERVEKGEFIYLGRAGHALSMVSEYGEELIVACMNLTSSIDSYNLSELKKIAVRAQERCESIYRELVSVTERKRKMEGLIFDQINRINAKASMHETGSVASTLYHQQVDFLQRALTLLQQKPESR